MIKIQNFKFIVAFIILTLSITSISAQTSSPNPDLLIFHSHEAPSIYGIYNPSTGYLAEYEVDELVVNRDGQVAYIQENDVWVVDFFNAPENPINITNTPDEPEFSLNWILDGDILEFRTGDEESQLYTLDGERILVATQETPSSITRYWNDSGWYVTAPTLDNELRDWAVWNGESFLSLDFPSIAPVPIWSEVTWTPQNHLFITLGYDEQRYGQPVGATDVFYWNGTRVQQIPTPKNHETFLVGTWSNDGRLLLNTQHFRESLWYIWDGQSYTSEGIPDMTTLQQFNTANEDISSVDWLPDGRMLLSATGNADIDTFLGHPLTCVGFCNRYVFIWSPEELKAITLSNAFRFYFRVHESGRFAVLAANGLITSRVEVFDTNVNLVFTSVGQYMDASWSREGYLAYCSNGDLFVWDGFNETPISGSVDAHWLLRDSTDEQITCSVG